MTDADLRDLVRDTQRIWGTAAHAEWDGDKLHVHAGDGRRASVTRGGPLRFLLDEPGRRPRPLPSVVALLAALRSAVGPDDPAARLRVGAAPQDG